MADTRADTDPRRTPASLVGRPMAAAAKPGAFDPKDAAVAIRDALQKAGDALRPVLGELESAKEMAVNHPVVPSDTRAELDSAFDHIVAACREYQDGVRVMDRVIHERLGTAIVCVECHAGADDPAVEPWHYVGCSLAPKDQQ